MAKGTLETIKAIEAKADKIISDAKYAAAVALKNARSQHVMDLQKLGHSVEQEGQAIIAAASAAAQQEAAKIAQDSQAEVKGLAKIISPKIETVKKEILRCLS